MFLFYAKDLSPEAVCVSVRRSWRRELTVEWANPSGFHCNSGNGAHIPAGRQRYEPQMLPLAPCVVSILRAWILLSARARDTSVSTHGVSAAICTCWVNTSVKTQGDCSGCTEGEPMLYLGAPINRSFDKDNRLLLQVWLRARMLPWWREGKKKKKVLAPGHALNPTSWIRRNALSLVH